MDIFNLNNTDDLDADIVSELKKSNATNRSDVMILELFDIKSQLDIDEIIVGLARKFHLKKKRGWVSNRLHALSKIGKISRMKGKKGIYNKIEQKRGL